MHIFVSWSEWNWIFNSNGCGGSACAVAHFQVSSQRVGPSQGWSTVFSVRWQDQPLCSSLALSFPVKSITRSLEKEHIGIDISPCWALKVDLSLKSRCRSVLFAVIWPIPRAMPPLRSTAAPMAKPAQSSPDWWPMMPPKIVAQPLHESAIPQRSNSRNACLVMATFPSIRLIDEWMSYIMTWFKQKCYKKY